MQAGEHGAKNMGRIVNSTAMDARMQVPVWAGQDDFQGQNTTQRIGHSRAGDGGHACIRNDDSFTAELFCMTFQKLTQVFTADFLLSFHEENKVEGKFRARLEYALNRFEVGKELPLIVCSPPAIDVSICNNRLKWIFSFRPSFQRFNRLHIIVPINHISEFRGVMRSSCYDNGVTLGLVDFCI